MPLYKVRDSSVVSEIIDGEAIIMDLKSGIYFSALGVGAVIWDGIAGAFDDSQIKQRVAQAFRVAPDVLEADFQSFVATAVAYNLARSEPGAGAATGRWSMELPAAPMDYAPPVLNRYGDMQDLALLDPIHDVEEDEGWPARKADAEMDWPSPETKG